MKRAPSKPRRVNWCGEGEEPGYTEVGRVLAEELYGLSKVPLTVQQCNDIASRILCTADFGAITPSKESS